jgi:hypothetical protein
VRGSTALKEEPQLEHPQPLPPPRRLTTPFTPQLPMSPTGTLDPLPFAQFSPVSAYSVPQRRASTNPFVPSIHSHHTSPLPPLPETPVMGFGSPFPAAPFEAPAPVVFPPVPQRPQPLPNIFGGGQGAQLPPVPQLPQPPPFIPGGGQGGQVQNVPQVPPIYGGQPLPQQANIPNLPQPPPLLPGGGPGGQPVPQPPGNVPPGGQPYYIYYQLPQQNDDTGKLKEPDVFTGKDSAKLPSFITQCTHWFLAKPRKFPTERDRVLFAASYLRDLANQWWMPTLTMQPPPPILDSWVLFASELYQLFGNQHLQTTSQNAILKMKMKEDGRVPEYLVRFNSHAFYTGWNDAALANHFYRGLPRRLKDRFAYMRRPQNYAEMRQYALDFDLNYWEYQEELGNKPKSDAPQEQGKGRKGKNKANAPSSQQNPNEASEKSSNQPTSDKTQAPTQKSGQKGSATTTTKSGPRGPLTQKQKDERRAKGLCLYCGGEGHMASDCPKLPSNRQQSVVGRASYTFAPAESHPDSKAVVKAKRSAPAATAADGDSADAENSSSA